MENLDRLICIFKQDIVLTAGHCLENESRNLTLIVGTWRLKADKPIEDCDLVTLDVPILHPQFQKFQGDKLTHDFLLLKLANHSSHRPIRINRDSSKPSVNQTVLIMGLGWGSLSTIVSAETLQVANLTVLSNVECAESEDPARDLTYAGLIDETMMCTGVRPNNTRDGCGWDSGAPLIIPDRHGDATKDVLVGLGRFVVWK